MRITVWVPHICLNRRMWDFLCFGICLEDGKDLLVEKIWIGVAWHLNSTSQKNSENKLFAKLPSHSNAGIVRKQKEKRQLQSGGRMSNSVGTYAVRKENFKELLAI